MEYTVDKFFFRSIPNWNCLLFKECFHCNVVFCRDQTIYSIYEYFIVNNVSINFKPNQTIFVHSGISCLTTIRIFTKTLTMNHIMEYTKNENFKYLVVTVDRQAADRPRLKRILILHGTGRAPSPWELP
jgi:hypothetical protein